MPNIKQQILMTPTTAQTLKELTQLVIAVVPQHRHLHLSTLYNEVQKKQEYTHIMATLAKDTRLQSK